MGVILGPIVQFTPMVTEEKYRGWVWTINNPTPNDINHINSTIDKAKYLVYGEEVGEEGTPHYQGYVYFKNRVRFTTVKSLLPRAHIEIQRGSILQAITYCKKDNNFHEWGDQPEDMNGTNQNNKWSTILTLAENGDIESIRSQFPRIYFQYYEKLKSFKAKETIILDTLQNEWWYGPTGTGKSRELWIKYPNHYQKQANKWWDGYSGQDVVAIEEWCPKNDMTASNLKIWADRYPFPAQIKNGTLHGIRPKKLIITSNYTMEQCFPRIEDLEPLKRRFKVIHFPFPIHIPSETTSTCPSEIDLAFMESLYDNLGE